jgi:putative oxidoreductase
MLSRALMSFGRFLLAAIFLWTAYHDATAFSAHVAVLRKKGIPFAEMMAVGEIGLRALGGLMLATGFHPQTGALFLIIFLVPTTILFHPMGGDPGQTVEFLKNIAILGGLAVVAGTVEGRRAS